MKNIDGFIRDQNNPGAVVNTDLAALTAYKLQKNKNKEIDNLRQEVNELKSVLYQILEKVSK
jgi:hypothetical protein